MINQQLSINIKLLYQEVSELIVSNHRYLSAAFGYRPNMKEDFHHTFIQFQKKIAAAKIQITEHLHYLQKGYIKDNALLALLQKLIAGLRANLKNIIQLTRVMQEYYAQ